MGPAAVTGEGSTSSWGEVHLVPIVVTLDVRASLLVTP